MIKKLLLKLSLCFLLILNVGCTELGQYAVTDTVVNSYLSHFANKPQTFTLSDLGSANVAFDQLNAVIGENGSDKVAVSGKAKVGISSFLGNLSTDMVLKLDARPVYDKEKGAIFLRELSVSDYALGDKANNAQSALIMPYLNKILQFYFDSQPIYTLDANKSTLEAMVLKVGGNMAVQQGKIVFSLAPEAATTK